MITWDKKNKKKNPKKQTNKKPTPNKTQNTLSIWQVGIQTNKKKTTPKTKQKPQLVNVSSSRSSNLVVKGEKRKKSYRIEWNSSSPGPWLTVSVPGISSLEWFSWARWDQLSQTWVELGKKVTSCQPSRTCLMTPSHGQHLMAGKMLRVCLPKKAWACLGSSSVFQRKCAKDFPFPISLTAQTGENK